MVFFFLCVFLRGGMAISNRIEHEQKIEEGIKNKLKSLPPYLSQFYYKMSAIGLQATTKNAYINYCAEFLKFLSPAYDVDLELIVPTHIEEFMEAISYKGNKKTSVSIRSSKLSALKTFFAFLKDRKIIVNNPAEGIRPPKSKGLKPVLYLTEKEIKEVEDTIKEGVGSQRAKNYQKKWRSRDLAIYFLFLTTGVRVEALAEIDVNDIDFSTGKLVVVEKGEQEVSQHLPESVMGYINEWMQDREKMLKGKEEKALFINIRLERLTSYGIRDLIKKYTANLDKKITPHKLRSTYATMVYQKTNDIYLVSSLIGHKNVNTTKRYAACLDENKKAVSGILEEVLF